MKSSHILPLGFLMSFCIQTALYADDPNSKQKFSIIGTDLSNSTSEIIERLSRKGLIGELNTLDDIDSVPQIIVSAGAANCEPMRLVEAHSCVSYTAAFAKDGNDKGAIFSIRLAQYFEAPVEIDALKKKYEEAYGPADFELLDPPEPQTDFSALDPANKSKMPNGIATWIDGTVINPRPVTYYPVLIWSKELHKIPPEKRAAALAPYPNPGDLNIEFPILRIFLNMKNNKVMGSNTLLLDPKAANDFNKSVIEWAKTNEKKRQTKALEGVLVK